MPIHKKSDKQYLNIGNNALFNVLFKYLENNNLLNPHQSGLWPYDSSVHQLLSIIYDIYKSFNPNPSLEVRGIFLDMSKVLDISSIEVSVWHGGLRFKLKRLGISGKYYGLINSFLRNMHQRVVLNDHWSKWSSIKSGVPQGSVLGPLFFLA